jgi:hypothetical protein
MINGSIPLSELFKMNDYAMPFPCVFLNEKGSCSIYKVRPLKCRIHGNGYTDLLSESKPCSILPRISSAPDKYVNLTKFRDDIFGFIFLKSTKGVIIRRPLPLFFFFALIFRDITLADCIYDIDFYKELTAIEAPEYIDNLVT